MGSDGMRTRKEWGSKGLQEGRRKGWNMGEGETDRPPEKRTQAVKKKGRSYSVYKFYFTSRVPPSSPEFWC